VGVIKVIFLAGLTILKKERCLGNLSACGVDPANALRLRNAADYHLPTLGPHGTKLGYYSKRQNTVEVSTFGSEITAMKNAIELNEALRYKLRMFGVTIDGATNIFCDSEAVTKNCSNPTSTLKKKHHSMLTTGTVRLLRRVLAVSPRETRKRI